MREQLEQALLEELKTSWRNFNDWDFGQTLFVPVFQLHDGLSRLGYWEHGSRTISISRDYAFTERWNKTLTVLKHEMVHQYIDEVLHSPEEKPHGPLFQSLCERFKVDSFEEADMVSSEQKHSQVFEKIRKLLSLATSENVNESEVAMNKANALMMRWNIERLEKEDPKFIHRHLGKPGRLNVIVKMLSTILHSHFFVEALFLESYDVKLAKRGRVLEICGLRENVEIAEYVYHYLLNTAEMHWKIHKKENKASHRTNYIYGLLLGFYEKLEEQQSQQKQDQALVWLGDPELARYFKKRYPYTRSAGSSSMTMNKDSFDAGKKQGRSVVISKGLNHEGRGGGYFIDKT